MTKNAALSLFCAAFLAAPVCICAQVPSDTDAVVRAAVLRQSQLIEARNRLAEATAAETRNELMTASQLYNKALETLKNIGGNVEVEHTQAITGLSRTMLALADQAMRRGDYAGAKINIDRVLKEDPRNKTALDMRKQNERYLAESYPLTPTPQALTRLTETETNKVVISKMVQDGKLYYETGRLKEAEDVLHQAIKADPDNKAAAYFLDLVLARKFSAEARLREVNSKHMLLEVEEQWAASVKRGELPTPNPYAETNLVYTSSERQNIYLKLRRIRLNEWGPIDNLPLSEVIKVLSDEARKRDPEARPEARGVNFLISPNSDSAAAAGAPALDAAGLPVATPAEPLDLNAVQVRVGNALHDVTLEQALEIITKVADRRIKYSVEDYAVVISPKAPEAVPLHTRTFRVDPNTFWQGLQSVIGYSFGESQNTGGGGGGGGGRGGGGGGRGGGGRGGGGLGGGGFGGGQGGQGQGGGAEYAQVSIAGQSAANRGQGGAFGQQGGTATSTGPGPSGRTRAGD
jgi:tetratricopeptide (TPR) repeat protein